MRKSSGTYQDTTSAGPIKIPTHSMSRTSPSNIYSSKLFAGGVSCRSNQWNLIYVYVAVGQTGCAQLINFARKDRFAADGAGSSLSWLISSTRLFDCKPFTMAKSLELAAWTLCNHAASSISSSSSVLLEFIFESVSRVERWLPACARCWLTSEVPDCKTSIILLVYVRQNLPLPNKLNVLCSF